MGPGLLFCSADLKCVVFREFFSRLTRYWEFVIGFYYFSYVRGGSIASQYGDVVSLYWFSFWAGAWCALIAFGIRLGLKSGVGVIRVFVAITVCTCGSLFHLLAFWGSGCLLYPGWE